jgi:alkylation response protein AidB-like acyl-CoA dehydrogenase
MNFESTERQKQVQVRAREFAQKEVAPLARETDEKRVFPIHLIKRMAELGFLGGIVPASYGGQGLDYLSFALVYEEIGRACSSVRGFLAVHAGLVSACIYDWGTEEQKQKYLPRLTRGEYIGCYALTEPNAGSDAAGIESTATPDGDVYILNGTKIWITNGNIAHLALIFASIDRTLRHKGICAFLVETDTPGFHREKMEGVELGHRASDHAKITLKNCRVPKSAVLGALGEGFRVAMSALDHGRIGVAAGAVGVAQACVDACIDFARNRKQFGKPLGDFQMIQEAIADMITDTEAARLLVYRAAEEKARGIRNTRNISTAKLFATEAAARAASTAVLLHGSYGYSNLYPVERYYRDIKGYQIYEGTSHIQKIIIARSALEEKK